MANRSYKEVLIDCLCFMEKNAPKRAKGLVSEIWFQRYLAVHTSERSISHDWMHTGAQRGNSSRNWYRLAKSDDLQPVDEEFIDKIKTRWGDDEFFFLIPSVSFDPLKVEFRVSRIEGKSEKSLGCEISSKVNGRIHDRPFNDDFFLKNYFLGLPYEEVERIFFSRCVLNYGLVHPSDIDAIRFFEGRLEVVEFKVKDTTYGYRTKDIEFNIDIYDGYFKNFKERVSCPNTKGMDREQRKRAISDYKEDLKVEFSDNGFIWVREDSFGLDFDPHCKTLVKLSESGIIYRYIIWEEKVDNIYEILDTNYLSKIKPVLLEKVLDFDCFLGFAFTVGDDSGSYNKEARFQLALSKKGFLNIDFRDLGIDPGAFLSYPVTYKIN